MRDSRVVAGLCRACCPVWGLTASGCACVPAHRSMVAKLMRRSPDIASVEAIGIGFSAESVGRIAKVGALVCGAPARVMEAHPQRRANRMTPQATFACPRLKRLSFSQCRIGDRGFSNVSDAIRVSTSIMDLDISDCQLGDKSIGAVTTILKVRLPHPPAPRAVARTCANRASLHTRRPCPPWASTATQCVSE